MNFVERLLTENRDRLGLGAVGLGGDVQVTLLTPRFATSRHVVALVYPKGGTRPRVVVKIPRQPGDDDGVQLEARTLRHLADLVGPGCLSIPTVLGTVTSGGRAVMVQTAIVGTQLSARQVRRDLRAATTAGTAFTSALPQVRGAEENADWYASAVERPLARLAECLPLAGDAAELCARTHAVLHSLRAVPLPAVFEHGDLAHPNLFLTGREAALGAIDWERATPDGVPGHDLTFFLQFLGECAEPTVGGQSSVAAFDRTFVGPGAWGVPVLRDHLRNRGLDPEIWGRLVVTSCARTAATLVDRLVPAGITGDLSSLAPDRATGPRRDLLLWRHAVQRAEQGML